MNQTVEQEIVRKNHFVCSLCKIDIDSLSNLKIHFNKTHQLYQREKYEIICSFVGCSQKLSCLKNMYSHIVSVHNVEKDNFVRQLQSTNKLSRMVALLTTSNSILTGVAIDEYIKQSYEYSSNLLHDTKDIIRDFVDFHGCVTKQNVDDLCSLINQDGYSKYLQPNGHIKAVKENFNYVEPISIPLGTRTERQRNKNSRDYEWKIVYESFQYIPILKTIENVMGNNKVRDYVDNEPPTEDGVLKDFKDGSVFKNHPLFKKYPHALRLQIYFDELLVINPLGTKTFAHKIGAFYFSILNLPRHINSYLGGIFLFALCYNADVVAYGISRILRPLECLESKEGVPISLKNQQIHVLRGTIANVTADSLAAHELFGLLSPSASFFCQLCMINRDELHKKPHFIGEPRTKKAYVAELNKIQVGSAKPKDFGIKTETILNRSKYFHSTSNFIFDPMHDLLESICHMVMKLVLSHLIFSKDYNLNIDTLNNRIHDFNYGPAEQLIKPSANFTREMLNSEGHKIKQKAMQSWCLTRMLPFILADIVGENDEYLAILLMLNRILEIVFAPVLLTGTSVYLKHLIYCFEEKFRKLFSHVNMINKIHHLRHYPECIDRSGPMTQASCARYEMKHIRMQNMEKFATIIRILHILWQKWPKLRIVQFGEGIKLISEKRLSRL